MDHHRPAATCFQRTRTRVLTRFDALKPGLFHLLLGLSLIFSFLSVSVALQSSPCWDSRGELSLLQQSSPGVPFPLKHAHSHNDYAQSSPLRAALMAGFCSVEADVFIKNRVLFVGHQFVTSTKDKAQSLEQLYLAPLVELSMQNRNGPVYAQATKLQTCLQVTLLVDIKSANVLDTYRQLELDLERWNANFTYFETYNGQQKSALPAPIRVVVTGLKPHTVQEIVREVVASHSGRARRTVLDLSYESVNPEELALAAWVSLRWPFTHQRHLASGVPAEYTPHIEERVRYAKEHQLVLRFWDTPEDPALWDLLLKLGVDLINTDRIFTLRSFLAGDG